MMRHIVNVLVGLAAALIGSALLALGGTMTVGVYGGYSRHPFEAMPWLLEVSVVPALLAAFVLGIVPLRSQPTRPQFWATAGITAFLVVATAGSAGAILLDSFKFGFAHINAVGCLTWCGVYAVGLLPLTIPLAAWVVHVAWSRERPGT